MFGNLLKPLKLLPKLLKGFTAGLLGATNGYVTILTNCWCSRGSDYGSYENTRSFWYWTR